MSINLKANTDGTSELLNNADLVLRFGSNNYPYDKDGNRLGISELSDFDGSEKVGFLQAGVGATARTVQAKLRDVVSVKDFGAVGDGVTDDTAAIQAAVNAACVPAGSDYWQTYYRAVYFPPGVYAHSGIAYDKPIELYGDGPLRCVLTLKDSSNKSAITISATPNTVPTNDSFRQHAAIRGLTINCNGPGQSTTSHGIHLPDSHNPMTTRYDGAIALSDVIIRAARDSNIYAGSNRNSGALVRVSSLYAGADGLTMLGYDWHITDSDFGNNTSAGVRLHSGGAHSFSCVYFYMNGNAGFVAGHAVNSGCTFDGCYIDTNASHGIYLEGYNLDYVIHSVNNSIFRDNGTLTYNTYSHIYLKNLKQTLLNGNAFVVNNEAFRAAYILYTDNSPQVYFTGIADLTNAATKPYATAVTNDVSKIVDESFLYDSWTAYTPTITAGSGSITAASATGKYRKRGKTIHWQASVTITTNGTGAVFVGVSLPFAVGGGAGQSHFGVGRNGTTGGAVLVEFPATGSVAAVRNYDNTYPGGNGVTLSMSGTYQSN